ncbi:pre-mRNA splicing factor syf2 [Cordyceps fumosorosea ARSEF 2679]|uniref:Pre-mRNA-splicing factor SYF2 n=1 Tax=Cordyceps fumosorosea (strain ARSEF 2679) TaxID=1081104 RepID=A0A167ZET9_CORFA|nr:pre-mRNA splicing factor syf2 [Cordyceps fumosorosea ARSEF 2679]OAA67428.1 pre-mRNA splicing factor syf2 [Cordyceps fumosorosea ARSEF 2679]
MSPPANKRRTRADAAEEAQAAAPDATTEQSKEKAPSPVPETTEKDKEAPSTSDAASKTQDRLVRFKALQARAKSSSETNMKEVTRESQRLAEDPAQLTALRRRHDIAAYKLLKADAEDAGEDFERKRAWDWTVDESERWDKRLKKKAAHRDNNAFQDYQAESNNVYKRQLKNLDVDLEAYTKQKLAAIEKAAAAGSLEIVETEDGEMLAVDKDGTFYATADSTSFAQNKPDKAAVDRLVADINRAEAQSLKKRRERQAKNGDDGDSTYINEKNKQFNQKLARFYDKYTSDIRDSFERGTMI